MNLKRILLFTALEMIGCGVAAPKPVPLDEKQSALNPGYFSNWTIIPGSPAFIGKPALLTTYSDKNNRSWNVCGTTTTNTISCNNRFIVAGSDSGWTGWGVITPPAGVTFGASSPSLATWTDNGGNTVTGIAARQAGGSCPSCIWLRLSIHAGGSTWYQIPGSGAGSLNGDISLVASGGYLYLFAVAGSGPYSGYYSENNTAVGYSNTAWTAWTSIPGNALLSAPISASPLPGGNGALLAGVGPGNVALTQRLFFGSSWDGAWTTVGPSKTFIDSISPTTFASDGSDVELFGLAQVGNNALEFEGDQAGPSSSFNGWYQVGVFAFNSSPTAFAPSKGHVDLAARVSNSAFYISEYNLSASCADGTAEQTFANGAVGCAGTVSWPSRGSLCALGSRVCTAADWVANRGSVAPTHDYWTNDNLLYSGTGTGACSVSTTSGNACAADQPMRVCTSSGTDAEGNNCNWTGCGLNSQTNQYFGGCNNNFTAGTLCCPTTAATCADGSIEQTFADGVVGCAGTVSWASRASLCSGGSHVCTAAEWLARHGTTFPVHDYWTDDNLFYSGTGPGACSVSTTSGTSCPVGIPMRICTSGGTDPEGNSCNWTGCTLSGGAGPFFGGCAHDITAGAVCCPPQ